MIARALHASASGGRLRHAELVARVHAPPITVIRVPGYDTIAALAEVRRGAPLRGIAVCDRLSIARRHR